MVQHSDSSIVKYDKRVGVNNIILDNGETLQTNEDTSVNSQDEAIMSVVENIAVAQVVEDNLVTYDIPKEVRVATDTKISVNGKEIFLYDAAVNNTHNWFSIGNPPMDYTPMTYFDFQGQVEMKITIPSKTTLTNVKISPISAGITPTVSGNTITFTISKADQYVVEYNGSVSRAITIFANPIETNIPNINDPNVKYIAPGVWNIGDIKLKSGQTLYIAGGAVVHGTIKAYNVENVKIIGRGIIDGSIYRSWTNEGSSAKLPIDIRNSKNVTANGVILMNPNAWAFNCFSSENVTVDNVKIMSARQNGDGFTIQSSKYVNISNSFVRSWDDSLVVKNYEGNSSNIKFDNIKVWTDLAQSCEIGYETNKGNRENSMISDVTFSNITVLHNFHKSILSIHNSDNALVQNIKYQNITVEDAKMGQGDAGSTKYLINIDIANNDVWSTTSERGNVSNVVYENITVLNGISTTSKISGFDAGHKVDGVTIKGLSILGRNITNLTDGNITVGNYVSGVTIE